MVTEATLTILQYAILFCTTLIFSMLAIEKKSTGANLLASFLWLFFAIANFMIGYSIFGGMISFIFGLVCFIFMGAFISALKDALVSKKKSRFEFDDFF